MDIFFSCSVIFFLMGITFHYEDIDFIAFLKKRLRHCYYLFSHGL